MDSDARPEGIDNHEQFLRKAWKAERSAWVIFGLILVGALLGFTGSDGYFARSTMAIGGASLEVPRFSRLQTSDELIARFPDASNVNMMTVDREFLDAFAVESIDPPPQSVQTEGEVTHYVFQGKTHSPLDARLNLKARGLGSYRPGVGVNGNVRKNFLFILP